MYATEQPDTRQRHIAAVLTRIMAEQGLSLSQLAGRCGYNKGHISRVLRGDASRPPTAMLAEAVAAELGHADDLHEAVERDRAREYEEPTPSSWRWRRHHPTQVPAPPAGLIGNPWPTGNPDSPVVIAGPPGSGKTAWSRWWADRITAHDQVATLLGDLGVHTPSQILASWLQTLGIAGDRVPHHHADRVRLWRALSRVRRLTVVIDNTGIAGSAEALQGLLPSGSQHAICVTSRMRLPWLCAELGATQIHLGPLQPAQARHLLRQHLTPAPHQGPALDSPAVEALLDAVADACGRLPAALLEAAEEFAVSANPIDLLTELRTDPLGRLASLADRLDRQLADLPEPDVLIAAVIAAHGRSVTTGEVAALRGTTERDAGRRCRSLAGRYVLTRTTGGCYRMPDLLAHAVRRADAGSDHTAAQRRWCAWWLDHALRAANLLADGTDWTAGDRHPWHPPAGLEHQPLTSREQARHWCASHLPDLPTVLARAAAAGMEPTWWRLATLLREHPPQIAAIEPGSATPGDATTRTGTDQCRGQIERELTVSGEA